MFVDVINCILFIFVLFCFFVVVSVESVEHILKLADEYQVTGVLNLCIRSPKEEPKDEDNVIKILHLANHSVVAKEDERLGSV